jgi:6-pyruvoyltetrahydropterin/6-carboxytetrahydropterin synthase
MPRYELTLRTEFCAAHAIVMKGEREPVHGHNWKVTVVVGGDELDGDGLLCDFHAVERELARIIAPFENADLNATPPFDEINPTAERVAQHIGQSLASALPPGVELMRASVTEAPGCEASFIPLSPRERG